MWLNIALGYCVVCGLIGFLLTRTECYWAGYGEAPPGIRAAVFEWVGVLLCVLLAPLYLPVILGGIPFFLVQEMREHRKLRRARRTFRAYEFVKVNNLHLDDSIRGLFELHTPPLIHLGYDLIGDYRLKPEPVEVHDRFFLSPDGETLAAICALLDTGSVCLISVLEDGTCVDTCSSENPHPERTVEPAERVWVSYLPDASMNDLHLVHLKTLQELCARNGTSVMHFRSDQFREVVTYDQRIHCRMRFHHGGMDQEPPAPDFSSLRATPALHSESVEQVVVAS